VKGRQIGGAALAIVASIWLVVSAALAFDGISNGSFETGAFSSAPYDPLNAGATNLTGWTIESGSIDWIGSYWQAADGARSIDLSGNGPGAISQTLATTIGNTYSVTFSMSGNPDGGPAGKTLTVGASGADVKSYTFDNGVAGNSRADMKWAAKEYSFVATSSSSVLTFTSTTPGDIGPALDNIKVAETVPPSPSAPTPSAPTPSAPTPSAPTPSAPSPSAPSPSAPSPSVAPVLADCKDDGWRPMHDAQGNLFKNQGDCVSYYATDGKNPGSVTP
jgi:choice-of-anchor C domain-containing protein